MTSATWQQFTEAEPVFAAAVWSRFAATKHHVLATLRRDGSPRVSGTEVRIVGPDLTLGSMLNALKAVDLRRDGRFALHSNPGDGSMSGGDAKLAGVAIEIGDPRLKAAALDGRQADPGPFHLFRLDLTEAVLTSIAATNDALVIRSWRPGEPVREVRR
ncbi:pyridoxamine 5'-phosphate oxidase family protein [Actinocrinis puniceicyclus]|uniref:Pyridoxamine 5'-phosphate oxidase family protein n=1 Tax=Actinocrinis puniceicyclus TaxID=977794 RepID=A0A8J7WTY8_9ACTN|nr:pyridoxamine 5'-phosphate oxidase family protein [Actinocrinis puniceicyclus]